MTEGVRFNMKMGSRIQLLVYVTLHDLEKLCQKQRFWYRLIDCIENRSKNVAFIVSRTPICPRASWFQPPFGQLC